MNEALNEALMNEALNEALMNEALNEALKQNNKTCQTQRGYF